VLTPAGPDTTPPVVSNVAVSNVTSTSATVSWTTDEPSTSEVQYGPTASYGQSAGNATLVTAHTVTLSGLQPGTTYHYRVVSVDAASNEGESADATFATAATGGATIFDAVADFSFVQGQGGWSYLQSNGVQLTPDLPNNRWKGTAQYLVQGDHWGHPGTTLDVVRRLLLPEGGTARITGTARDLDATGGNGVVVYIKHGATTIWQATILNGGPEATFDVTVPVQAGDTLDFGINSRGNVSYDATYFWPVVTLQ
jgi:hypothetical protein